MIQYLSLRKQAYICWSVVRATGWIPWYWPKDTDPGCGTCGISWLYALPADHPFSTHVPEGETMPPCHWHDNEYDLKRYSRKDVDLGFYQRMLKVCDELEQA